MIQHARRQMHKHCVDSRSHGTLSNGYSRATRRPMWKFSIRLGSDSRISTTIQRIGQRGKKKPVAGVPKSGRNPIIESRSSVTGKTTDTFSYDTNLLLQLSYEYSFRDVVGCWSPFVDRRPRGRPCTQGRVDQPERT